MKSRFRTFDKSSDRVKIIPGIFREIVLPIPLSVGKNEGFPVRKGPG